TKKARHWRAFSLPVEHFADISTPIRIELVELLFDTSSFTGQVAQVVQFGAANITTTLQFYTVDQRRVSLEYTLNTFAVGDLANGESRVQTAVTLGNHDAFESLQTLFTTFFNTNLNT